MSEDFAHVRRLLAEHPWAIVPSYLEMVVEIVGRHLRGERLGREQIDARLAAARRPSGPGAPSGGGVAVVPLAGILSHRASMVEDVSGPRGMSTERFVSNFRSAHRDPDVSAIVLDVNSPGGSIHGVEEAADEVFSARGEKPIVAVANAVAGSAAYWIAAQADELVVTPSGEVGSVGVYALHEDWSRHLDGRGVTVTYVSAGRYKVEGAPELPLSDDGRDYLQSVVNDYHGRFVAQVARGRGVAETRVRREFGEGRMVPARRAVALRMGDSVATLQQTLERLRFRTAPGRSGRSGSATHLAAAHARARLEFAKIRAEPEPGRSVRPPRGLGPEGAA